MELSRDKIKEIINDDWLLMDDCEGNKNCDVVKELARIALASLEAEAAYFINRVKHSDAYGDDVELRTYCYELDALKSKDDFGGEIVPVYAAPPAPVSVPDLKPVGFLFAADDGAVAYSPSGWPMEGFNIIGQIYGDVNACRAAMLQGADGALTNEDASTAAPQQEVK